VITVPLGVLQQGALTFDPSIAEYQKAFNALGYGSVIKLLLHFKDPFWSDQTPDLGFLISDQTLPTWWTVPGKPNLLTGWFAGPRTIPYQGKPEADILTLGLDSLSRIYHIPMSDLRDLLTVYRVDDWSQDPFALGAYSYAKVGEEAALKLLRTPVAGTLYFAGEGLYQGEHTPGTVEAALATGREAAEQIQAQ
jgi:monoamine oxidase